MSDIKCQRHVCNAGYYLYRQTVGIVPSPNQPFQPPTFGPKRLGDQRKTGKGAVLVSPFYELLLACWIYGHKKLVKAHYWVCNKCVYRCVWVCVCACVCVCGLVCLRCCYFRVADSEEGGGNGGLKAAAAKLSRLKSYLHVFDICVCTWKKYTKFVRSI